MELYLVTGEIELETLYTTVTVTFLYGVFDSKAKADEHKKYLEDSELLCDEEIVVE